MYTIFKEWLSSRTHVGLGFSAVPIGSGHSTSVLTALEDNVQREHCRVSRHALFGSPISIVNPTLSSRHPTTARESLSKYPPDDMTTKSQDYGVEELKVSLPPFLHSLGEELT